MLRPREIQARIRSGQTAEDVAAASGLPIEHIRRFEGPVLTERAWVAQQAQATEVRRPGGDIELGDLVSERLHAEGVDPADISWDAWRRDDGTWVVIATFPIPPNTHVATWTYDSGSRTMTVVDDNAGTLSAIDPQAPLHLAAARPMLSTVAPLEDEDEDEPGDEPAVITSRPPWGQVRAEQPDEQEADEDVPDEDEAGVALEDREPDEAGRRRTSRRPPMTRTRRPRSTRSRTRRTSIRSTCPRTARRTRTTRRTARRTTTRQTSASPARRPTPRTSRCSRHRPPRPIAHRASPACRASTTSCSVPARASRPAPATRSAGAGTHGCPRRPAAGSGPPRR